MIRNHLLPASRRAGRPLRRAAVATLALVVSACGSSLPPGPSGGDVSQPGAARYFDATITSFDGTPIAATVFVPPLRAGQTAPLILHGNGWASRRTMAPSPVTYDPNQFYHDMHDGMVTRMWQAGYVVISIDNRGWGDSGGEVNIMDPQKEVRDYSAVIDWAESHLPVTLHEGRALVGAVGGSYGGGFQTLLAAQDERVKAIAPWVTWYDLRYSLAPNGVPRSGHVTLLYLGGTLYAHLAPWITQAYAEALAANTVTPDVLERLYDHSPARFCEAGQYPRVDALFVQGTRDTLFNLAEGYQNYLCFKKGGGDVRLLVVPNGHLFTEAGTQAPPTSSLCGTVDPFEAVVAWYDEKLKGIAHAADGIPRVCIDTADGAAFLGQEVPVGGATYSLPPTTVTGPGVPAPQANPEVFVPFVHLTQPMRLAGIPTARLQVSGLPVNLDPILFVGIAVQHADGTLELINDQVLPLRGVKTYEGLLPGLGRDLQAGEVLGLALYAAHAQYFDNGARLPYTVTVSGQVALPLSAR